MARPLRIEYPGAFYHVYSRGLERREIFRAKKDYEKFLKILTEIWKATSFICHAYCLLPNHDHFYLETPLGNLSKIMQELNGRYTQYYNWKYKRKGPLFQGRYKAKLIDKDNYSLRLVRYIHLNPVKAKLVRDPHEWLWSSYRAYLGQAQGEVFLETKWLLAQVGHGGGTFRRYTLAGLKDSWDPLESSGRGPVIGTEEFVEQIKSKIAKRQNDSSLTGLRELRKGERVKEIEGIVAEINCSDALRKKLLMYGWRRHTMLSLKEVGEQMGGMSAVAVSQAVRRLSLEAQRDKQLRSFIKKLECQM